MLLTFTITGKDLSSSSDNFKTFNPHKDMKFRKLTIKSIDHNIYGNKLIQDLSSSIDGIDINRNVSSPLFLDVGEWCDNDEVHDIGESDTGLIPMGYALRKPENDTDAYSTPTFERIVCDYCIINHPTHWTTSTDLKFAFKYMDIATSSSPRNPVLTKLNNNPDSDSHTTYDNATFIRIVMEADLIDSH